MPLAKYSVNPDKNNKKWLKICFIIINLSFCWILLSTLNADKINAKYMGFGLVSVLPVSYYAGLLVFIVAFVGVILTSRSRAITLSSIALLIVVLFGTATFIEGTPRFSYSFINNGVLDYLIRLGHINTNWSSIGIPNNPPIGLIAMFQNWPAVYLLGTAVYYIVNVDTITILLYTPVISQLIYIAPLYLIFKEIFKEDLTKISIAITIFFLANWVNQDYFSSQNMGILFLLFITYFLIKVYVRNKIRNKINLVYSITIFIFFIAIVMTHGLSSIAALLYIFFATLAMLMLSKNRKIYSSIYITQLMIFTLFFASWSIISTSSNMLPSGVLSISKINVYDFFTHFFQAQSLGATTSTNDASQMQIILLKNIDAMAVGVIACLGLIVLVRTKLYKCFNYVVLFLIIIMINIFLYILPLYENESIIRIFLFSLLPMAFFSVFLVNRSKLKYLLMIFIVVSIPLHLFIHYGKESVDYTSPGSLAGMNFFFDKSRNNASISSIGIDAYRNYEEYNHVPLSFDKDQQGNYQFQQNLTIDYVLLNNGIRSFGNSVMIKEYEYNLSNSYNMVFECDDFRVYSRNK